MLKRVLAVTMAGLAVTIGINYLGTNQLKAQSGPAYSATSLGQTGALVIWPAK
jgi:hypothetical protein